MQTVDSELLSFEQQGLRRTLKPLVGIDFCSNDYLGFSKSKAIHQELLRFLEDNVSLGSTGSRLISGDSDFAHETETSLAKIFGRKSALFFGSGYLANLGVMSALGTNDTEFFSDELNHASLIDGLRLTNGKKQIFRHNDLNHLEDLVLKSRSLRKVVVTESVFSMDGDTPDLPAILSLCERTGAFLVIDEAHSTGVCGKRGLGHIDDLMSNEERTIVVHTGGKALGGYGAFVITGSQVRDLLIQKSRSFIYSTALPPILLAHILIAVRHTLGNPELRTRISDNLAIVRTAFKSRGLLWNGSHIGFLRLPGNQRVLAASEELEKLGFQVKAIRSPTVKAGEERLRFTIKAFHSQVDIERLATCLAKVVL